MTNFATLVDTLITAEMNGNPRHEVILELGPTPTYLINDGGFSAIPLVVTGKVIGKSCFDHGVPKSVIKRLPEIVQAPKSLFYPDNGHEGVVVVTFEIKAGYPIILPVRQGVMIGRSQKNIVTSFYAKEGPPPEQKWEAKNLLIKKY